MRNIERRNTMKKYKLREKLKRERQEVIKYGSYEEPVAENKKNKKEKKNK